MQWLVLTCLALLAPGIAGGEMGSLPGRHLQADTASAAGAWVHVRGSHPVARPKPPANATAVLKVQYGKRAVSGMFPYIAALFEYSYSYCTGTLIHPSVVMTAAHCLRESTGKAFEPRKVKVGLIDTRSTTKDSSGGVERGWKKLVVHEKYDGTINDIGLVFLDAPVTTIKPVQLAASRTPITPWRTLTVAGFGNQDNDAVNYDLRVGVVSFVPPQACQRLADYLDARQPSLFCAGYTALSTDVCSGDSGGPAVFWSHLPEQHIQVGITSAGLPCQEEAFPIGQYTKVSQMRNWIDATIARHLR